MGKKNLFVHKKEGNLLGFTLVEIIVSVSIIALLGTLGLVNYIQFNRRQIFSSAMKAFVSDLKLAQSKAQSGERPASGCSGDLLDYQVQILIRPTGVIYYRVFADCVSGSVLIKTAPDLNPSITKTSGFNLIKFKTLRGGVETNPIDKTSVVFSSFRFSQTISIGSAGEINY